MQYFLRPLLSMLLCLFLVQCSNNSPSEKAEHIQELDSLTEYRADSKPAYKLDLVQKQTFGGGEDPGAPYFRIIADCAVDDSGQVIIRGPNNNFKTELYVYNPDGTHRRQIGRIGRGPDEYGSVSDFQINAGRFFLLDETNKRLSIFTTDDYALKKTTNLQNWNVRDLKVVRDMNLSGFRALSDGNLLAIFQAPPAGTGRTANTKFMLVDTEGNALSPKPLIELRSGYYIINKNPGNSMFPLRMQMSFMGRSLYALSDDDAIYTAQTDDFLIKKYDSEGTYQSAFYYPVTGPPFDIDSVRFRGPASHSQRAIKNALEKADAELPETAPVLRNMRVDDKNRIWATVAVGWKKSEWWVLGESGKLLAKFTPFDNQAICSIKNGYFYTKYYNPQGDDAESKVIKYKIKFTKR